MITIEPEVIYIGFAVGLFLGTISAIFGHLINAVFRWMSLI